MLQFDVPVGLKDNCISATCEHCTKLVWSCTQRWYRRPSRHEFHYFWKDENSLVKRYTKYVHTVQELYAHKPYHLPLEPISAPLFLKPADIFFSFSKMAASERFHICGTYCSWTLKIVRMCVASNSHGKSLYMYRDIDLTAGNLKFAAKCVNSIMLNENKRIKLRPSRTWHFICIRE